MHLPLPQRFPLISASSVCKSLRCLTSTLTQGGKGGHLLRLTCSVVLWGGGTLPTNVAGVCGACSQCVGHTGLVPAQGYCASWASTAQAPRMLCRGTVQSVSRCVSWVFHKDTVSVGHAFCILPRSEQFRQPAVW